VTLGVRYITKDAAKIQIMYRNFITYKFILKLFTFILFSVFPVVENTIYKVAIFSSIDYYSAN